MIEYEICPMTTDAEMDEKGYVHWKSWQETYTGLMPDDYLKNITLEKCIKMAHKWPQNTFLLKVDDKTVGFSCMGKSADAEGANEVIAIYLLKEYHSKGLGYALLNQTVSRFAKSEKIVLWVLEGNEKAINFYKKFGFDFNGNRKPLPFGVELQMELKP
ncbi:MAG: GNAT family N-acetyltransferase [Ruminococcaceae bacterium]|nr:GNAT family N-acetyltransferase [Oscillospiraceae bacterium]